MTPRPSEAQPEDEKWCKAQRLQVAGALAPRLRGASERTASRRVSRVDKNGKVVGYITLAEVQKALLRAREIEFEVVDGARPLEVFCERCGLPIKVQGIGTIPKVCRGGCERQTVCAGFGDDACKAKPPKRAFLPREIRKRHGDVWRCRTCSARKRMSDPARREKNAERLRKAAKAAGKARWAGKGGRRVA